MLQQLLRILHTGLPNNTTDVPQDIHDYWNVRNDIHTAEKLLFMGDRLIVPAAKQSSILQLIHEGHIGIQKYRTRARLCLTSTMILRRQLNPVQYVTNTETVFKRNP